MRLRSPCFALCLALSCYKVPPEPALEAPPEPTAVDYLGAELAAACASPGAVTVLHLNDVYRIEGLLDGRGGLARVRTLRRLMDDHCSVVLLTHGGDAFFPSLASRAFTGKQMADVLDHLDGAPGVADPKSFYVFGNHEFDKSKLDFADDLGALIATTGGTWLAGNIAWKNGEDGQPLVPLDHIQSRVVINAQPATPPLPPEADLKAPPPPPPPPIKVGIFGLSIDSKVPDYVVDIDHSYETLAARHSAALRAAGARVVIGLTHLDRGQDVRLVREVEGGPDIVLGGHDHAFSTDEAVGGHGPVLKGDADAVRVRVVVLRPGEVPVYDNGIALGPDTPAPDPAVAAAIARWLGALGNDYCAEGQSDCLAEPLTVTRTPLLAEELKIRRFESNLGDYVADQMLETFAAEGAALAFVNSGSLRLNQDIAAGTTLTRQVIEETFAYPVPMRLIEISGADLQRVADRSVEDWTGQGHWLQVGGWAFRHVVGESARGLTLLGPDGAVPIDPNATYRAVTVDYLLDPSMGDQDGYGFLSRDMIIDAAPNGTDLKARVLTALRAAGEAGIAPVLEGRICSATAPDGGPPGACLAGD